MVVVVVVVQTGLVDDDTGDDYYNGTHTDTIRYRPGNSLAGS